MHSDFTILTVVKFTAATVIMWRECGFVDTYRCESGLYVFFGVIDTFVVAGDGFEHALILYSSAGEQFYKPEKLFKNEKKQ